MATSTDQPAETGAGSYLERRYYIDIGGSPLRALTLLAYIKRHVAELSPGILADFEKTAGTAEELTVDTEFDIKILGPWNGRVRVTDVGAHHFTFQTLDGHPEAGQIRFSVEELTAPGRLRFEIHSLARSRDGFVAFAYETLGLGKQVQEQTWVTFCERVVAASGGVALGPVHVVTTNHDDPAAPPDHHTR